MERWEEIEAIKRLKYTYLRSIDTADMETLRRIFAKKASCAYYGGSYTIIHESYDEIMKFLEEAFHPEAVSVHTCHHPEIDLIDDSHAEGQWYLTDKFIDYRHEVVTEGSAIYRDKYVKEDGEWKIQHTGYTRIYEELLPLNPDAKLTYHHLGKKAKKQKAGQAAE